MRGQTATDAGATNCRTRVGHFTSLDYVAMNISHDSAGPARRSLVACLPGVALACSCGCGVFDVGTDSMFPEGPGVMAFVEYDVLNQDENWHGNSRAPSGDNEDKRIETGFMSAGVRYMFDPSWGVTLVVPYWDRHFRTTDEDTEELTTHTHSAFGDARIVGVYSGFAIRRQHRRHVRCETAYG